MARTASMIGKANTAPESAGAKLWRAFLDALFPRHTVCLLCGQETQLDADALCATCRASLEADPRPPYCQPLDGLVCAFAYTGGAANGVRALKYQARFDLAPWFAQRITLPSDWHIDAVVPVPLHPLKQWRRSYNQSELIAKALCACRSLPLEPKLLRRTRYTRSQTHLDAAARVSNMANAFDASALVEGRSILLVDDVTTTHSTLYACADALKQAGAAYVYAACACAAVQGVTLSRPET